MFRCQVFRVFGREGNMMYRVRSRSGRVSAEFTDVSGVGEFLLHKRAELRIPVDIRFGTPYDLVVDNDGPRLYQRLTDAEQLVLLGVLAQ